MLRDEHVLKRALLEELTYDASTEDMQMLCQLFTGARVVPCALYPDHQGLCRHTFESGWPAECKLGCTRSTDASSDLAYMVRVSDPLL